MAKCIDENGVAYPSIHKYFEAKVGAHPLGSTIEQLAADLHRIQVSETVCQVQERNK